MKANPKAPKTPPTSPACYLGIDPGKQGGLALISPLGITACAMPEGEREVWRCIAEYGSGVELAVIERVHSMPKQGVASTFTFGQGYGFLRGCLTAAGIPFEEALPKRWQTALGIPPRKRGEEKPAYKRRLLAAAQRLFPKVEVTLKTADALLLAEYARRIHTGGRMEN